MNTYPFAVKKGDNIIDLEQYKIAELLQFQKGEKILFYHSLHKVPLFYNLENFIILSNKALYKVDNSKIITNIQFAFVDSVKHQNNGYFKWDNVVFELSNGETKKCSIFLSDVAKFFAEYVEFLTKNK